MVIDLGPPLWNTPEAADRVPAALVEDVNTLIAGIVVAAPPEPPPVMSWPEMLDLMCRAMPPKRVLLVAPERVEGVQAALDAWKARETDWAMAAELNAIEVRGDDDGVFVRDPDEGWVFPDGTCRRDCEW